MAVGMASARTVSEYFGDTAADSVFISLPAVSRLDMVDYFTSAMTNPTKNELGSLSRITSLNDTTLTIDYTSGVTLELTLLPGPKPVLMLIETLPLPERDSRISFYDENWQPLSKSPLKAPSLNDWLTADGQRHRDEVEATLPFILSTAHYDAPAGQLVLTSTTDSYFSGEKPHELKYLRPGLVYLWNGKSFKIQKQR